MSKPFPRFLTVQFKVEFSVERCVGEEIEEKQCYSLLIAKNVFKALGVGPFTTQVIGLSPLVAKLIQMIISFEDETNFVRLESFFRLQYMSSI